MVTLIGLDLAWTAHRPSGWCLLRANGGDVECVEIESVCLAAEDFAARIAAYGGDVVAAVDAPLLVSDPALGQPPRTAERALNAVFGRFAAGAYSANLAFLTNMNGLAGPQLGAMLRDRGFELFPSFVWQRDGHPERVAFEMYPHAAHVVLFGLERRIGYKKGRTAARREGLALYQAHLGALLAREAPGALESAEVRGLLSGEALAAKGRALKAVEDQLDALTCAAVAWHAWRYGAAGMRVFGDSNGYIAVPRGTAAS